MRDPVAPFLAHQLVKVRMATAAESARATRAASDARDLDAVVSTIPLPIFTSDEARGRLLHEPGHCIGALHGHADEIEALIRPDGTGWCSYTTIENPFDAITCHLAGFAAEARSYPPALGRYAHGCCDFTAARLLIDKYNEAGRWPPLTYQSAAERAVEFVDAHWNEIRALALALGSTGTLTDYEVRLFAGCGYVG